MAHKTPVDYEKAKRKKTLHLKKSLDKEISEHNLDHTSSSETEDVDFSKEIHPIGYYINDKELMIEQMFTVLKGEKLKNMLPPVLQKYSLEELKADCLVHLLGMSKKRIFAILEGRDLNSSSDSETDSDSSTNKSDLVEETQSNSVILKSDSEDCDDTLDISVSKNDVEILTKEKTSQKFIPRKKKKPTKPFKKVKPELLDAIEISDEEEKSTTKRRKKIDKSAKSKRLTKLIESTLSKEKVKASEEASAKQAPNSDAEELETETKGKSLLEILELEMRARAIRALLNSTPNADEPVPVSILDMKADPAETSKDISVPEIYDDDAIKIIDEDTVVIDVSDDFSEKEDSTNVEETKEASDANVQKTPAPDNAHAKKLPEKKSTEVETKKIDEGGESWSQRWAESKNVKTIMQNNKLCSNIKKRMRFAKLLKKKQTEESQMKGVNILEQLNSVEEGSVEQLNLLKSFDEEKRTRESEPSPLREGAEVRTTDENGENSQDVPKVESSSKVEVNEGNEELEIANDLELFESIADNDGIHIDLT